ncbi:hypothetical protein O181_011879 [Austropuccinia psidii MF-1]|uniref:Uncharacterized protein n=1 Tax=Austropuccinia psidii MF-1 TaxID=1389203 RepID=A0A9Q3GMA7_9BASI|nr:hypothetical protein [Austropuccinia psidii MF-1]
MKHQVATNKATINQRKIVMIKNSNNALQSNTLDSNKRLENLERLMDKLQSTLKISSVNVADTPLANDMPASDSDNFMISCYHSLGEQTQGNNSIYLDSGAGRTVVKDLSLLTNPVKVNKKINTFSLPVTVTHMKEL